MATITSKVVSGIWSAPGTWNPDQVPGASDTVTIQNGHTVILDDSAAATI